MSPTSLPPTGTISPADLIRSAHGRKGSLGIWGVRQLWQVAADPGDCGTLKRKPEFLRLSNDAPAISNAADDCIRPFRQRVASRSWNLLVSDATGSSVLTTASISSSMTSVTCGQFGRRGNSRATACSDSMSR